MNQFLKFAFIVLSFILSLRSAMAFTLIELPVDLGSAMTLQAKLRLPIAAGWYIYAANSQLQHSRVVPPNDTNGNNSYVEAREGGIKKLMIVYSQALDLTSVNANSVQIQGCDGTNQSINFTTYPKFVSVQGNRAVYVYFPLGLPNVARYRVSVQGLRYANGTPIPTTNRLMYQLLGDVNFDKVVDATDDTTSYAVVQLCAQIPSICHPINPSDPTSGYLYNYDVHADFTLDYQGPNDHRERSERWPRLGQRKRSPSGQLPVTCKLVQIEGPTFFIERAFS